ncbi:MAG: hypothetical protein WC254_00135 [Candidatus Woesearchaeota archaeon]|jgi:hypothetical protein
MNLQKILTLFFLVIFISSCSLEQADTVSDAPSIVSIGVPFQIAVGETVSFEGHYLTFNRVDSDSRCPIDVKCIWAGEATVVLVPQDNDIMYDEVHISTQTTDALTYLAPDNKDTFGYVVSLNSLSPVHEVGKEIQQSEYIATLTISLLE